MGYYTKYSLSLENDDDNSAQEYIDSLDSIINNIYMQGVQPYKWYEYRKDMLKLSRLFPNVTFILEGKGEEDGDLWKEYFKDNKNIRHNCRITYPPNPFEEI